jgi:peptide/nickel transport system permease protein
VEASTDFCSTNPKGDRVSAGAGATDLLHADDDSGLDEIGAEPVAARSPLELFWRRFRRDKVAMAGLAFIVLLVIVAILAGPIVDLVGAPGPNVQQSEALDDFGLPEGPSSAHLFGVDPIGRDVFSRVLYGAQVSLQVAVIGTGLSVIFGVILGMISGFYRRWVDTAIARSLDVMLAFPVLLLGLGLATACSGADGCAGGLIEPGLSVVILIIVLANTPYVARIIRGQVLSLREKEFVEASRSLGASNRRIMFRDILPNLVAPIIVYATLFIPANILLEAALSFLGVGVQPPRPSWGAMLADAVSIFDTAWWFMFFPGMALLLTVLAFNLVGDGLQDALNPKSTSSR